MLQLDAHARLQLISSDRTCSYLDHAAGRNGAAVLDSIMHHYGCGGPRMNSGDIRAYYAAFGQREWARLERAEGIVEFTVTTAMLEAHLPERGCVLDIGGGPG